MFDKGYYITAELSTKDRGKVAETKQALQRLCSKTLEEPGCTIFTLHQCAADETRFLLWERFNSEADFHDHFEQPYTKEYLALDLTEVVQYFVSDVV